MVEVTFAVEWGTGRPARCGLLDSDPDEDPVVRADTRNVYRKQL